MIMKCGKKIEAVEKETKEAKTVRLTPIPSAGSSTTESSTLSRTSAILMETLSKDVEVIKTKLADISLRGNKNLDINSDNVAKWVEGKFEAFLKTPITRNKIREIVTAKLDSFQVCTLIHTTSIIDNSETNFILAFGRKYNAVNPKCYQNMGNSSCGR